MLAWKLFYKHDQDITQSKNMSWKTELIFFKLDLLNLIGTFDCMKSSLPYSKGGKVWLMKHTSMVLCSFIVFWSRDDFN